MNRESDEQRAVSQTLCGALQKEANCKCLVLSVLIYGCLAAVTWCRCANVTKVVINFDNYPLKRTEHVSPCDEGYIYIPVAFMGMLYLVYLVECYHSPIRIDLFHADSQDNVMTKLSQLRLAQPTIWWKAVSYHYVRRKRQITRYRNGDNYTTTQVYYERANTHAATSFYFYDYCGVKDISKDLSSDSKIPITKITLSKGFAFSNMRSATEFEEARSRFFAEQELRDDYMEMREGLDLGYNFNSTTVVGILGNPWFTNAYVYWCLSALLLSWPLRIIIEYNTQYADYQITKLFGVNYDTPTSGEQIHASSSQLSAPGSYMLAPSYSEALLMDPSPLVPTNCQSTSTEAANEANLVASNSRENFNGDIVPSYSEALLYERATGPLCQQPPESLNFTNDSNPSTACECFCHTSFQAQNATRANPINPQDHQISIQENVASSSCLEDLRQSGEKSCSRCRNRDNSQASARKNCRRVNSLENSLSQSCLMTMTMARRSRDDYEDEEEILANRSYNLTRDLSAPNFSTTCDFAPSNSQLYLRLNGNNSLENIMENEDDEPMHVDGDLNSRLFSQDLDDEQRANCLKKNSAKSMIRCGTIPKCRGKNSISIEAPAMGNHYRLIENPLSENDDRAVAGLDNQHRRNRRYYPEDDEPEDEHEDTRRKITSSKTYFSLKSILKQHRRRYTLVTTEELEKFATDNSQDQATSIAPDNAISPRDRNSRDRRTHQLFFNRRDFFSRNRESSSVPFTDPKIQRVSSSRSLIFPSPIEESCRTMPNDPFGGKAVHVMGSRISGKSFEGNGSDREQQETLPRLTSLAKSLTSIQHKSLSVDSAQQRLRSNNRNRYAHHRRNLSVEPEYLFQSCRRSSAAMQLGDEGVEDTENADKNKRWERRDNKNENFEREMIHDTSSIVAQPEVPVNSSSSSVLRHQLTRGVSLNENKAERLRRPQFLRASLNVDTSAGSASSFSSNDDENRRENNLTTTKRFNISMETSL